MKLKFTARRSLIIKRSNDVMQAQLPFLKFETGFLLDQEDGLDDGGGGPDAIGDHRWGALVHFHDCR